MSNSPLVNLTLLSPNCTKPRNHKIDTLTPHHAAGVLSLENALEWFSRSSTQAAPNYILGNDGRIGLSVEEKNRSWCTSSRANDHRAITFEVCNSDTGGNWPVSDRAFDALVALCTDICRRYGKKKLLFIPDKAKALAYEPKDDEMKLTMHKWFANTDCPGAYLESKFPELAKRVTENLNPVKSEPWYIKDGTWQRAKELGLMDGTRATANVTRAELAAVAVRLHDELKEG
jgi:hypothetical protein